jgi:hypothetical protein
MRFEMTPLDWSDTIPTQILEWDIGTCHQCFTMLVVDAAAVLLEEVSDSCPVMRMRRTCIIF